MVVAQAFATVRSENLKKDGELWSLDITQQGVYVILAVTKGPRKMATRRRYHISFEDMDDDGLKAIRNAMEEIKKERAVLFHWETIA